MMLEYKVLAQSDSFWRDRFSPSLLEAELNKLARDGWRVVTCATTEFAGLGGLGTRRNEVFVMLERERPDVPMAVPVEDGTYNPERIPADRWYAKLGTVSTMLANSGVVTKEQVNEARAEMQRRGGHFCDHLLALGFITDEELRAVLQPKGPG